MPEVSLEQYLQSLHEAESSATGVEDLLACDRMFIDALEGAPYHVELLLERNRFRLRHAAELPHDRPRVLIGGMNDSVWPNFHTLPLLRVADVVSLTVSGEAAIDRLRYDYYNERFADIVKRLPAGFEPDLFWDNFVMGSHLIPVGIEQSPFPTAAGFGHLFLAPRNAHAAKLFDVIVPISNAFVPGFEKLTQKPVLDIPFGLNWASFHHFVAAGPDDHQERDIDVSVTLHPDRVLGGHSNSRWRVVRALEAFRDKYGDRYRIHIEHGLDKEAYLGVLRRSRISLNVPGIHGPYNYRTCEVMAAGALLMQLDSDEFSVPSDLRDYFADGEHLSIFSFENLEEKLLHYLENAEETNRVALAGRAYLAEQYSYERLYTELFRGVAECQTRVQPRIGEAAAYLHLGLTYWHYQDKAMCPTSILALIGMMDQEPFRRANNLMVLVPRWLEWHKPEAVYQMLAREPDVVAAFQRDVWEGVEYLHAVDPSNAVFAFNFAMKSVEAGRASVESVSVALAVVEADEREFDAEQWVIQTQFELDYLDEIEAHEILYGHLHHPLLAAAGDGSVCWGVWHAFMRGHLHRFLLEHDTDRDTDVHLEALLSLFPRDSELHLRAGRRFEDEDPQRSREHLRRAAELDPTTPAKTDARVSSFEVEATRLTGRPRSGSRRPHDLGSVRSFEGAAHALDEFLRVRPVQGSSAPFDP